eukprot:765624-Hanusia_phi.AAC.1
MRSTIRECGVQVWGASLFLADWILGNMKLFQDCIVLELGAGVGLPGLVASRVCRRVFLTDFHEKSLQNCLRNVVKNEASRTCCVRKLDWNDDFPKKDGGDDSLDDDWVISNGERSKSRESLFGRKMIMQRWKTVTSCWRLM